MDFSRNAWTTVEANVLRGMLGSKPWTLVLRDFNTWAAGNGYPCRSAHALNSMAHRMALSRECVNAWMSSSTLASRLGLSSSTVRRWIRIGVLPAITEGRKYYVSLDAFRLFAERHPGLLAGLHPSSLADLLGSFDKVRELSDVAEKPGQGRKRKLLCVTTGDVFDSIGAAAVRHHVTRQALSFAIKNNRKSAGMEWRLVDADLVELVRA